MSAIFLGVALSIKYLALFFALSNALFLVVLFYIHRIPFKEISSYILRYALIVVLIAGFWYVKNTVNFSNPVYPMFSSQSFVNNVGTFIMPRNIVNFIKFPFVRYGNLFFSADESSSRLVVLGYYILLYLLSFLLIILRNQLASDFC